MSNVPHNDKVLAGVRTWGPMALAQFDPRQQLSEIQAASVMRRALQRAAKQFNPEKGTWDRFAVSYLRHHIQDAIAAGHFTHPLEDLADDLFPETQAA